MKILFKLNTEHLILSDASYSDVEVIARLGLIKNPYRKDYEAIIKSGPPQELSFYADNDSTIIGINDSTDKETVEKKIKALEEEVNQRWNWYSEENKKAQKLEARVKELESQINSNGGEK